MSPSPLRRALLAGATGLVGRELAQQIVADERYGSLCLLLRRPSADLPSGSKVQVLLIDYEALPALPSADDVYVALGTTIKVAGSKQAFRRVDYDYVMKVAQAARCAGATRLGIVSAVGANASSRVFYNRVKGELERDVISLGYESVVLAQPSLLLGDREALGQPPRSGEVIARRVLGPISNLIPAQVRPVAAADVAHSLRLGVLVAAPGVTRIASRDMHRR
jgi:uncharacterized protein YbjT (DUF2867 family)